MKGNPFFPEVNLREFGELYRIPRDFSDTLALEYLKLAVASVNNQLSHWRHIQTAETLADVEAERVNGENVKVTLYKRAVYTSAMADTLRESPTFFRRKEAENAAKSAPETESHYNALSQDAIRQIQSRETVYVEMI